MVQSCGSYQAREQVAKTTPTIRYVAITSTTTTTSMCNCLGILLIIFILAVQTAFRYRTLARPSGWLLTQRQHWPSCAILRTRPLLPDQTKCWMIERYIQELLTVVRHDDRGDLRSSLPKHQ